MWVTERARRLARQPLRWTGDTDPGTCERCGAEGAIAACLFNTEAITYDLCRPCIYTLTGRRWRAARRPDAWYWELRARVQPTWE